MLYKVGRFLQLVGLLILPAAIAGNVARQEEMDLKMSLAMSGMGIGVFVVGYLLQQANRPR